MKRLNIFSALQSDSQRRREAQPTMRREPPIAAEPKRSPIMRGQRGLDDLIVPEQVDDAPVFRWKDSPERKQHKASAQGSIVEPEPAPEPAKPQADPKPQNSALVPYGVNLPMQEQDINALSGLSGFLGACVVDCNSGMLLGQVGNPPMDMEIAAAVNSEVVKAKLRAIESLQLDETIEDILITLDTQYHLIRPLNADKSLFIYLALSRKEANLAISRISLKNVEKTVDFGT